MNDPLRREQPDRWGIEGVWTVWEIRDSLFFAVWLENYRRQLIITND